LSLPWSTALDPLVAVFADLVFFFFLGSSPKVGANGFDKSLE
jgi:hypothetical protein